jgi:hypothetical protein
MSRGVQRCRLDGNHTAVMAALRNAGMTPLSLAAVGSGCPDILVGWRGINVLLEVKDGEKPPSARALTVAEQEFHDTWPGQVVVVDSPEAAVLAVIAHAKGWGV